MFFFLNHNLGHTKTLWEEDYGCVKPKWFRICVLFSFLCSLGLFLDNVTIFVSTLCRPGLCRHASISHKHNILLSSFWGNGLYWSPSNDRASIIPFNSYLLQYTYCWWGAAIPLLFCKPPKTHSLVTRNACVPFVL